MTQGMTLSTTPRKQRARVRQQQDPPQPRHRGTLKDFGSELHGTRERGVGNMTASRKGSSKTSRTGTAAWFRVRDQRRSIALDQGLHNCPNCHVELDWERSKQPSSAEVDHIISHSQGGTDELSNTQILCRLCNQRLGAKSSKRKRHKPVNVEPETRVNW